MSAMRRQMAKSNECQRPRPRPTRLFEGHPSTVGRLLANLNEEFAEIVRADDVMERLMRP